MVSNPLRLEGDDRNFQSGLAEFRVSNPLRLEGDPRWCNLDLNRDHVSNPLRLEGDHGCASTPRCLMPSF